MRYFFVEIPVPQSEGVDFERAARTLLAAQSRLSDCAIAVRLLVLGATSDDGLLVCLIEAETVETVRRLVGLALLPDGRIRQVLCLALPDGSYRLSDGRGLNPGADLVP